ncbi:MAG: hypothetical protein HOE19_03520 [Candidatus Komeilibacteria bacterium]|jgi:hypothetical protein|nr:hypothetical protein [Candidatus Komeilibacteria bacterium]MBT4447745.1 hypothetical protein [Candidatus Komeilibacteria bacterium]
MKKISKTPAIIATIIIVVSFFDVPYGYYNFLKFIVTGVSAFYAYTLYGIKKRTDGWFWLLIAIAALFNPFLPIHLYEKSLWIMLDIVVVIFYFILVDKNN